MQNTGVYFTNWNIGTTRNKISNNFYYRRRVLIDDLYMKTQLFHSLSSQWVDSQLGAVHVVNFGMQT